MVTGQLVKYLENNKDLPHNAYQMNFIYCKEKRENNRIIEKK